VRERVLLLDGECVQERVHPARRVPGALVGRRIEYSGRVDRSGSGRFSSKEYEPAGRSAGRMSVCDTVTVALLSPSGVFRHCRRERDNPPGEPHALS
jgi:hypothetical protein